MRKKSTYKMRRNFHHHEVLTSISNQKSNLIILGPSVMSPKLSLANSVESLAINPFRSTCD
jgi:hypothetical protein